MTTLDSTSKPRATPASTTTGELSAPKIYLNEVELAERQGRSIKTLRNQRVNGDGVPFRKFGRAVRYFLPEVEAWEASRARKSTSDQGGGR